MKGTMMLNGKPCAKCRATSLHGVVNGCYRNSRVQSVPMSVHLSGPVADYLLVQRATCLLALSERALRMHVENGIPRAKIELLPNFGPASTVVDDAASGSWIYTGRLSEEKGLRRLMEYWPLEAPLQIVGDGPMRREIEWWSSSSEAVDYLGVRTHEEVLELLTSSRGVVVPSIWAEGAVPQVYLEAIAAGLPVLAQQGNAAADDIHASGTGATYTDAASLKMGLDYIHRNQLTLRRASRARYAERYTPAKWLESISGLYTGVLGGAGR